MGHDSKIIICNSSEIPLVRKTSPATNGRPASYKFSVILKYSEI